MNATASKPAHGRLVSWGASEDRLLARARRDGDNAAMEELVTRMLPLARTLARKYQGSRDHLDDLVQVASLALFKALQRFDPTRGVPFTAFAVPCITGELKRYHRDFGWGVHVPRSLQERATTVAREASLLSSKLGRTPTADEVAARCHLSVEEVLEARHAGAARDPFSLDVPIDDEAPTLQSPPGAEDPHYRQLEEVDALRPAIRSLPQREQWILALRFGEDLTQHEIADRVGISQMHVSRLLNGALERILPVVAQAA